eukprot:59199-Hanusia_phi.AAC.1
MPEPQLTPQPAQPPACEDEEATRAELLLEESPAVRGEGRRTRSMWSSCTNPTCSLSKKSLENRLREMEDVRNDFFLSSSFLLLPSPPSLSFCHPPDKRRVENLYYEQAADNKALRRRLQELKEEVEDYKRKSLVTRMTRERRRLEEKENSLDEDKDERLRAMEEEVKRYRQREEV